MRNLSRWATGALLVMLISGGLVLDGLAAGRSTATPEAFPQDQVIEVELTLSESDWEDLLANGMQEREYPAAVNWNGVELAPISVRAKGNSSLMQAAQSATKRYSLKLRLDAYIAGQNLNGIRTINLQNSVSDPSYLREILSYEAFASLGVPVPTMTWVRLTVNGELRGLYLAVEQVDEPMLERYFGDGRGDLYKPEFMVGQGADLKWYGNSFENYPGIVYKTKAKNTDHSALIAMLDTLNNGGDLEAVLDVDEVLRYWAVSAMLSNFDSYPGSMLHNYYLYEADGKFRILPWDLNMSFGGFGSATYEQMVAAKVDEPTLGPVADRPLIAKLLEVPEYREKYHEYLQELIDGYFDPVRFEARARELQALIAPYVEEDPTKFYSYEEFLKALDEGSTAEMPASPAGDAPPADGTPSAAGGSGPTAPADGTRTSPAAGGETDGRRRQWNGRPGGAPGGFPGFGSKIPIVQYVKDRAANVQQQLEGLLPSSGDGGGMGIRGGFGGGAPMGWPGGQRPGRAGDDDGVFQDENPRFPPDGMIPEDFPKGMIPEDFPQDGMIPEGFIMGGGMPEGFPPKGMEVERNRPRGMGPVGMGPNGGFGPNSNQQASLLGVPSDQVVPLLASAGLLLAATAVVWWHKPRV